MEKRLILAVALSLLVLLSWSALVSKTQYLDNKGVITKNLKIEPLQDVKPQVARVIALPPLQTPTQEDKITTFSTDNLRIEFSDPRAAIKEIIFTNYRSHRFPLKYGFALDDPRLIFKKELATGREISFIYSDRDQEITKRFLFDNSRYTIELDIEIRNIGNTPLKTTLTLIPAVLDFPARGNLVNYQDVTVSSEEKILRPNPHKPANWDKVKFVGWRERYFCGILEPPSTTPYQLVLDKLSAQESQLIVRSGELLLTPGEKIQQKFRIYLGPQELRLINSIKPEWTSVVYYGTFDFIARLLIQLLGFLYQLVHNWGLAIVLLSITIYFILYPLTLKQMRSMKAMQALQPRIEQLRATYKDNPQRLNKEIMELYRQHKVNPFGGCLPMILQIPIFFALYQVLMRSVALKGACFLWVRDLSEPDKLFILSQKLPFLGEEINILPILMALTMFAQQKLSAKSVSSASAEQQKLMLILFPIMFGFIFYRMPSGLVLYWFVNSSLMLIQQLLVNRAK